MTKLSSIDATALAHFADLPDEAFVGVHVLAALLSCSVATVWRRAQSGQLAQPIKLGEQTTRWRVGVVRAHLRALALAS